MGDIIDRLRFDATRCELQFSKGVAGNITEAADEIERLRERLGPRGLEVVGIEGVGHYVNEKVKAEIERLRGGQNWRRYASYEILRQAVIELRRSGDISGVTTEKAKKLFREIKTGYEEIASREDAIEYVAVPRSQIREVVDACVNPGDGGAFEAGEFPALDTIRAALTSTPGRKPRP